MAIEINVPEFEVATRTHITPGLVDGFFQGGPLMAFHKDDRMELFGGGTQIQDNFLFRPMVGGPYIRGGNPFNLTKVRTRAAIRYGLKLYYINITEYLEDLEIELQTPEAVFDTVKADMETASLSLSQILEIALMHHGQDLSAAGGEDRSMHVNGIPEALNDGVNASWEGSLHASYGGQRRVDVAPALTPPTGLYNPNIAGPLTNSVLEHTFRSCVIGAQHPLVGITTQRAFGYLQEHYMPLQRAGVETVEPTIGYPGIKFHNATIVPSNLMPGAGAQTDTYGLGNYDTDVLWNGAAGTGGETFLWYNPGPAGRNSYVRLWLPRSKKFQFGFTGWKVAQGSTMLAGQILVALQYVNRAPRLSRLLHGITA